MASYDLASVFDDPTGPVAPSGWFLICPWLGGAVTAVLGSVQVVLGVKAGLLGLDQVGPEAWFTTA